MSAGLTPFIRAGASYYAPLFGGVPVLVRVVAIYGDTDLEIETLEPHADWDGVPQDPGTIWSYDLDKAVKQFQEAPPRTAPAELPLLPAAPAARPVPRPSSRPPPRPAPAPRRVAPRAAIRTALPNLRAQVAAAPRAPAPPPVVIAPPPLAPPPRGAPSRPRRFGPSRPAPTAPGGRSADWARRVSDVQAAARSVLRNLSEGKLSRAEQARVNEVVLRSLEANDDSDEAFRAVLMDLPSKAVTIPAPASPLPPPELRPALAPAPAPAPPVRALVRPAAPAAAEVRLGDRWRVVYAGIEFAGTVSEIQASQVLITTDSGAPVFVPDAALRTRLGSSEQGGLEPVPF